MNFENLHFLTNFALFLYSAWALYFYLYLFHLSYDQKQKFTSYAWQKCKQQYEYPLAQVIMYCGVQVIAPLFIWLTWPKYAAQIIWCDLKGKAAPFWIPLYMRYKLRHLGKILSIQIETSRTQHP